MQDTIPHVSFDGSTWQVSSSCVANITASFDNVAGILTITHDGMNGGSGYNEYNAVDVNERDSLSGALIHARVFQVNHTQIKLKFRDKDGNVILTPNTDMRIFFSRPGFKVPHTWSNGTRAYFNFGHSLVRPNNLVSVGGNLWLLGMHQAN